MSEHELTDDQREIRALARRFAQEEIAPLAAAWDREHRFPVEIFTRLGELGLMGACVPVEHGGAGADFLSYVLALEQLAQADAGVAVTVAVHTSAATLPLLAHGTPEQVGRLVPALAQGLELGAFALTESGAGSDASALRARADVEGRITGSKQFITTGSHAHVLLVFAREADDRISAYVVRRPAPGLTVTREEEKLGLNSSSTAALAFDAVPAERLGPPGAGMRIALSTLDGGRIGIAAQAVGIAQAALDVASAYAKERNAFGGPIGRFGQVQQKLADMQTESRGGSRPHVACGTAQAGRSAAHGRGRAGQAVRLHRRAASDGRGDPGARRLRLHEGLSRRALLPRREGDRDLRGHLARSSAS